MCNSTLRVVRRVLCKVVWTALFLLFYLFQLKCATGGENFMGSKFVRGVNDLSTWCRNNNRLDLLDEWDYDKNEFTPSDVCYGAGQKVWWIGSDCGHSYEASLNKRTNDGTGCPYCCKSHAKLLKGFNDLQTTNPEILRFWNYEKNDISPDSVMKGQHLKVWWICEVGHSYLASIYHTVQGRRCPECRKERQTSFPEQAIYFYIKNIFPDAISDDRNVLNGKELDIYIPSIRLGIEFDGSKWHSTKDKDILKNNLCIDNGILLIRVRDVNCPKLDEMRGIYIVNHTDYSDESLTQCILQVADILNVRIDVDLDRDRALIYNQYLARKKDRSLIATNPILCKEWDYIKNGALTPYLVTAMSNKKVWWKCQKGHSYQSVIHARSQGHGCPYCNSNRLLKGFNDLSTVYPDLVSVFDTEKNELIPQHVSAQKNLLLWWKCEKGHSYQARLQTMIKHMYDLDYVCPLCQKEAIEQGLIQKSRKILSSKSACLTLDKTNPECLLEWDYDKNTIKPSETTAGSSMKVYWICPKGHSYAASVSNHLQLHRNCPYCSNHKVLEGFNDLQTLRPEVMSYWDFEHNERDGIYPNKISCYSGKKAWWKCSKGHSRLAVVSSYKLNSCPVCSKNEPKRVMNMDTGEIFDNLSQAAKSCGLKQGDTISLCCKGKQAMAGGYRWSYYDSDAE